MMYSAAEQPLLDRRRHAALEQHRHADVADRLEQQVVLHVARADLEHVGVARDQRHVGRRHHLGDDRQAGLVARGGQDLQALLAQAPEVVGRGARLEGAAAQHVRAGRLARRGPSPASAPRSRPSTGRR